jgi:2-polyprenyl-3-methyl-5-hydroxy-6-metoxy-1,4-benzoquinol methylase
MKEDDIRKRDVLDRYLELVREDVDAAFNDRSAFDTVPCPACAGHVFQAEFEKVGFSYVSCANCGTLFVNPRPSAHLLNAFYADSPSTHFWINDFFLPMVSARQEKIFRPRAESLAKRFGEDPGWMVGDIGAGFGLFLEELRKIWPKSRMIAIEPSTEQASICRGRGLDVIENPLEQIASEKGGFDLLVAFELMEHLHDPASFMDKVNQLLRPGGWFYVTTLNGRGFDIQLLWEKSKAVFPPHHLNFFNTESISALLVDHGLQVQEVLTPGRLDYDIVEGMVLQENVDVGRFWKLIAEKASVEAKEELQQWITKNRFSSHMSILAKKHD